MLNFKSIGMEDAEVLEKYYSSCEYESSEYSVGIKLFWNRFYPYEYGISKSACLVVKYHDGASTIFDMPVPAGACENKSDAIDSALDEIDEYCVKNYIVPVFSDVQASELARLAGRYNFTKIENFREAQDYVYSADNLKFFKGRHYAGQRNHINKFKSLYPDYHFCELKPDDKLDEFWDEYYSGFDKNSESAIQEEEVAMAMTACAGGLKNFVSGCIKIEDKIAAICVAEVRGDTMITHIEKALTRYEGIYPLMVSEFLQHFAGKNILWVNREDDSSDRGLRISKQQYGPDHMVSKYVVLVQSELLYVSDIPTLQTERLTLCKINPRNCEKYQQLCLDDERNKYWGYDFKDDLEQEYKNQYQSLIDDNNKKADFTKILPPDYFYQIAKNDFSERMCLNFEINLNGNFIGEVVLYEADYKGSIELGCRILKEYSGNGYGTEAFAAAANWAIYKAGFRRVIAKCYKENSASYRMLSSCMRRISEDEQFFYFEKQN